MGVVVTGGAGFIGGHLVRALAERDPGPLIVLDALTYAADLNRLRGLAVELVEGSVADPSAVRRALGAAGPNATLFHLAAESHVDRSLVDAAPFLQTNVVGTQVLLDCARDAAVRRFVHVSTDEVYGPVLVGAVAEDAPFRPGSPYAASKAAGELLVGAAVNSWGLPAVIARPANVFGTHQYPEKLIPVLIRAALRGEPLPLYGDGLHERDWLDVGELVEALLLLADHAPLGAGWNIPGTGPIPNRAVAEAICVAAGASPSLIRAVADRPGHDRRYSMRGDRIASLGFRASKPLLQALPRLVEAERVRLGGG